MTAYFSAFTALLSDVSSLPLAVTTKRSVLMSSVRDVGVICMYVLIIGPNDLDHMLFYYTTPQRVHNTCILLLIK